MFSIITAAILLLLTQSVLFWPSAWGIQLREGNAAAIAAVYNSFYMFYNLYSHTLAGKNVTRHLDLLSHRVTNQKLTSSSSLVSSSPISTASLKSATYVINHLKWLMPHSNVTTLTDIQADNNNSLFMSNGKTNKYDMIILGHQEYVTQQEYDNLRKFVANGGTLFILDPNIFYGQVSYDRKNQMMTLVKGHSWAFNGRSAWKSITERWKDETSQWVGSNYLSVNATIFTNNPFEYSHHEEQHITNSNDKVLLDYNASVTKPISKTAISKPVVASYELSYKNGKVVVLGIYSDDVITKGRFNQFLDILLLKYTSPTY